MVDATIGARDERPKASGCLCRLLALTTALACLAALLGPRVMNKRRYDNEIQLLTEAAKRRGGTVRPPAGEGNMWADTIGLDADFDHRVIDDDFLADLCWMPGFRSVVSLSLSDSPITDAGIAILRRNPHLVRVNVARTTITDRGVESLVTLPWLQSLQLSGTKVTDAGLEHILEHMKKPRPRLHQFGVDVTDTAVTEEGVRKLFEATKLDIIYGSSKAPKTTRW